MLETGVAGKVVHVICGRLKIRHSAVRRGYGPSCVVEVYSRRSGMRSYVLLASCQYLRSRLVGRWRACLLLVLSAALGAGADSLASAGSVMVWSVPLAVAMILGVWNLLTLMTYVSVTPNEAVQLVWGGNPLVDVRCERGQRLIVSRDSEGKRWCLRNSAEGTKAREARVAMSAFPELVAFLREHADGCWQCDQAAA